MTNQENNDDPDFSELFDNFVTSSQDPYITENNFSDDLRNSGLASSNISLQPDISVQREPLKPVGLTEPSDENDFFLPDLGSNAEENEPYQKNSDLKS